MPITSVSAVATSTFARVVIEWFQRFRRTISPRQAAEISAARLPEIAQAATTVIATTSHHGDDVSTPSIGFSTILVTTFWSPMVAIEKVPVNQSSPALTGSANDIRIVSGNAVASTTAGASSPAASTIPGPTRRLQAGRGLRRRAIRERGESHSPAAWVRRSRTIAMMTIARPASNAVPTSTLDRAITMFRASPGAPMRPAMTTMERLSMMVWLIPSAIARRASGSSTLRSRCIPVAPNAAAASTVSRGTPRIPSEVIRMAAGSA